MESLSNSAYIATAIMTGTMPKTKSSSFSNTPLIITYPEFLTRPPESPPLVSPRGFMATLYSSAAIASLIYSTSRFLMAPMADALTNARKHLHYKAADRLGNMVLALEDIVDEGEGNLKELWKARVRDGVDDTDSNEPITELFSYDIGVQTSEPLANQSTKSTAACAATVDLSHQNKLAAIADMLKQLQDDWESPRRVLTETQMIVEQLQSEVDNLSRPTFMLNAGDTSFCSKSSGYVMTTRNEPDDEIRRAKENIRRVKGALLTTRTFPTAR